MKGIIFFLAVMLPAGAGPCWAGDHAALGTDALEELLSNLKQSVEQLSTDNKQLTRKDNAMKQEVDQLQAALRQLQQQEHDLNKTAAKLRLRNQRREGQISRLEKENFYWDDRIQKNADDIQFIQQQVNQGQGLQISPWASAGKGPQMNAYRQIEKLKLLKMIYDSQLRQGALHESILDYEKEAPPWDDARLAPKTQSTGMTASQHAEQSKLEGNINDLNRQEAGLKTDLEDLRSQMMDLNKRKSSLEMFIRQQP